MRSFSGSVVAAALFLSVLAGCPGPTFIVQQYPGAQRPPESIATLRVNGADSVRLVTLDGEDVRAPIETDSRLHIELLPGEHRVTVANALSPDEHFAPLVFNAEPGKFYRVTLAARAAQLWEVDRGSDATTREIPQQPVVVYEPAAVPVPMTVPMPVPVPVAPEN